MSQYRVTITYRGKAAVDCEAASPEEAEELALAQWERSEGTPSGEAREVLSVKAQPADGASKAERTGRSARMTPPPAEAGVIETEADVIETRPLDDDAPSMAPSAVPAWRRWWPYLWLVVWLVGLWALANYGPH